MLTFIPAVKRDGRRAKCTFDLSPRLGPPGRWESAVITVQQRSIREIAAVSFSEVDESASVQFRAASPSTLSNDATTTTTTTTSALRLFAVLAVTLVSFYE